MNIKRTLLIILSLSIIMLFTACGDDGSDSRSGGSTSPGVNDVLEQGMAEADGEDAEDRQSGVTDGAPLPEETGENASLSNTEGIDIDLTSLSSTMVYSEVYNIMTDPTPYIGKVVKMEGMFNVFHDETTDKYYYGCIIMDATACCAQGLEFVPPEDLTYPDDFPAINDMVTVTGTLDTYEEGEYRYVTLRDAVMEI